MKRILITGGAGFVGSSLALRLRCEFPEAEIICLDNLYRKGSQLNRERLEKQTGILFIEGDVRDKSAFDISACDLIIDAAAEPSVLSGTSGTDVSYVVDTNLVGTLNILEAARKWDSMLLFISTSRVYPLESLKNISIKEVADRFEIADTQTLSGVSQNGISEEFSQEGTRTLYGATKYASEIMVREYASMFSVKALINRCGVLSGAWQMGRVDQGVIALWVAAHFYGFPLSYIGYKGKQVRDVLHIDDFGDLVIAQLRSGQIWQGEVYNVGGGIKNSVSLRELTAMVSDAVGKDLSISVIEKNRDGDIPLYITDSSKVIEMFRWKPKYGVRNIIEDIIIWLKDNEKSLQSIFLP